MADYTAAEITAAVEKVVLSAIRRPYGRLGNREVQATFDDLQSAAAGVFILEPNSPFYVVYLGTRRLAETLVTEQETVLALIEAVENCNRVVSPIEDLSPLVNARVALQSLEGASSSRVKSFQSIADVPAFKRYDQNLQAFLDNSSKNAKKGGKLLPTPAESRAAIPGLVRSLQEQHFIIRDRVQYLIDALEDYDALELPSAVATAVVQNARQVLASRIDELSVMTPAARLSKIHDVTLDLLAGRAAVKGLGSISQTTTYALLEGTGISYADENHLITPGFVTGKPGPYAIVSPRNELDVTVDGDYTFNVLVPGSYVAFALARQTEPYDITAGEDDRVIIQMPGFPDVDVTLTPGFIQTVDDVVADLQAGITTQPLLVDIVFSSLRFVGTVNIGISGPDTTFTLTTGSWEALGVIPAGPLVPGNPFANSGDLIRVTDATSSVFGELYRVLTVVGNVITAEGVQPGAPELLKDIEMGSRRVPRIRIDPAYAETTVINRTGFSFASESIATGLKTLGFAGSSVVRSRATSADQIASDVPLAFASQQGDRARMSATVAFAEPVLFSGKGRTDPDNPAKLIASHVLVRTAVTNAGFSSYYDRDALNGGSSTAVAVGDTVVIRETSVLADQGKMGTVTAFFIGDDEVDHVLLQISWSSTVTPTSDVLIEVGPTFVLPSKYLDLRVSNSPGLNNDGDYSMDVDGQGSVPFEFILERTVPNHRDLGGMPVFFDIVLGNKAIVLSSTEVSSTQTRMYVFDSGSGRSAAAKIFSTVPAEEGGQSTYYQLSELPASVTAGDLLELYDSSPLVPDEVISIVALEPSLKLLVLETPITLDSPFFSNVLPVSVTSQVPFSRIRLGKKNNYMVLKSSLEFWMTQNGMGNMERWFVELNRLINPLVVSGNPTAAQVDDARTKLRELLATLTVAGATKATSYAGSIFTSTPLETILKTYTVRPSASIDTLIDTFLARGSTRGIDILLQGRFTEFFGLSPEAMTHGGYFREQLREVTRLDLPVRKVGRQKKLSSEMIEREWEDTDFSFVSESHDAAEDIVVPADFDEFTPPGF